jgi:hypothetical protein
MSQLLLTARVISNLKSAKTSYFIRDTSLKEFGVKVNPSGRIKYIAEVRYQGRTHRSTVVDFPDCLGPRMATTGERLRALRRSFSINLVTYPCILTRLFMVLHGCCEFLAGKSS